MTAKKHQPLRIPEGSTGRPDCSLILSAMLFLIVPLVCQGSGLEQLLSGQHFPLVVKLKDLNGEWRRITVRGNVSVTGNVGVNVSGNSDSGVSQNNLIGSLGGGQSYLTKGRTASSHGRSYLVAYHLANAGLDLHMLLQAVATKTPPAEAVLTPESTLSLSLLDVRTIGSLEDVSAFDIKREINDSENAVKALTALLKAGEGAKKAENTSKDEPGK